MILASNGAECLWHITCPSGDQTVSIFFELFSTEQNYDYVNVLDGPYDTSYRLEHLSGSMSDISGHQSAVSSGSEMTVQFTSDSSVTGAGFDASYSCGGGGH